MPRGQSLSHSSASGCREAVTVDSSEKRPSPRRVVVRLCGPAVYLIDASWPSPRLLFPCKHSNLATRWKNPVTFEFLHFQNGSLIGVGSSDAFTFLASR